MQHLGMGWTYKTDGDLSGSFHDGLDEQLAGKRSLKDICVLLVVAAEPGSIA